MNISVFTKSMLRQFLRTVLLVLLLIVASFSFVMRSAEYIIISEQINEISGFFRPIGFLGHPGDYFMTDVRSSAEIVSDSPYVELDDRRRTIEGVLLDMPNTGSHGNVRGLVGRHILTPEDAFFYGTLTQIHHGENNPYIVLTIEVDHVMLGYPEHVSIGQALYVHYFMDINEIQTGETAIDHMIVGERYFLRGVFYDNWLAIESGSPAPFHNVFVMHPLSEVAFMYPFAQERNIPRDGVWYAPAPLGEPVNLLIPGLENLYNELRWNRFSLSIIRIQTTVDMSYMPLMQPQSGVRGVLTEGRWVDREDNELSRPVVAVHQIFAEKRELSIGDTLRIGIPPEQRLAGSSIICTDRYRIISVIGEVFAPLAYTLELEIVGIFEFANSIGMLGGAEATTFVYMPDSVLPPDVTLAEFEMITTQGGESVTVRAEDGFISPEWYSFVLNDPGDADAFVLENREALGELGFTIEFMPGVAGAQAFWESAESILQTVGFNLVLFSVVAVLLLILTVFLYIRQRYKDYAILLALGNPARKTNRQLLSTFMILALPTTVLGGAGGWFVAHNEATRTLEALPDTTQGEIGIFWLPLLIIVVLVSIFLITAIGILSMSHRSPLEMLQGGTRNRTKAEVEAKTSSPPEEMQAPRAPIIYISEAAKMQATEPTAQVNNKNPFPFIFVLRHISRQQIKTLLTIAIALLFVLALGYLQTAIVNTELEVDHMYETTIVAGEIRQADSWDSAPGRFHNNVIRPRTITNVAPLVINEVIMTCHEFAVLTKASEDGVLPENWDEIAGINIDAHLSDNIGTFDTLVGVSNLEGFVQINSRSVDDENIGFSWESSEDVSWVASWYSYIDTNFPDMLINFEQGFSPENFVFVDGSPIPIIVSYHVMGPRGYELGDIIYIGTSTMLRSWEWNHMPAVIVGTHNRNELSNQIRGGTLIPLEALEYIVGDELRYISMHFEINPMYNREIARIQEEITEVVEHIGAGDIDLGLFLDDEELRMVVVPMEQNLSLLRLLYPVAIALSAVIGLGISVLLMLQNAKVAAIMRVLGTSRKKARITLCVEQMVVCLLGLAFGLVLLTIFGWGFGIASSIGLAGLYFSGVTAGAIIGAIVVTNKAPLELLQVKE